MSNEAKKLARQTQTSIKTINLKMERIRTITIKDELRFHTEETRQITRDLMKESENEYSQIVNECEDICKYLHEDVVNLRALPEGALSDYIVEDLLIYADDVIDKVAKLKHYLAFLKEASSRFDRAMQNKDGLLAESQMNVDLHRFAADFEFYQNRISGLAY